MEPPSIPYPEYSLLDDDKVILDKTFGDIALSHERQHSSRCLGIRRRARARPRQHRSESDEWRCWRLTRLELR